MTSLVEAFSNPALDRDQSSVDARERRLASRGTSKKAAKADQSQEEERRRRRAEARRRRRAREQEMRRKLAEQEQQLAAAQRESSSWWMLTNNNAMLAGGAFVLGILLLVVLMSFRPSSRSRLTPVPTMMVHPPHHASPMMSQRPMYYGPPSLPPMQHVATFG